MMNRPRASSSHTGMAVLALLLLSLGCRTAISSGEASTSPGPESLEALVMAMGERLAVMPQVAEWKRAHDRPIRDRARERIVHDNAVGAMRAAAEHAQKPSFSEAAVRRFYQAQIDAAVEIQTQVLSRPAKPGTEAPNLHTVIRPRLDHLGARIADLLVVQDKPPDRLELEDLAQQHWRIDGLMPETQERVIVALEALLSEPRK